MVLIHTRNVSDSGLITIISIVLTNFSPVLCFIRHFTKKGGFPLRICSLNVTKSAVSYGLVTFTEEMFN